eukprot:CAMPEP_0183392216 /NCGR_PEP_ID=MMETSP0370-20130417/6980_1 /TAXON_ID=268820 /ORGANISM="Peridinium aciculiferum, Strain PAER-2" /LENGTH=77 /DNA_ID=CAMNT_0025572091 /DNA_START=135 /DNA_END=368 /DNA_ORIENTATION=-
MPWVSSPALTRTSYSSSMSDWLCVMKFSRPVVRLFSVRSTIVGSGSLEGELEPFASAHGAHAVLLLEKVALLACGVV